MPAVVNGAELVRKLKQFRTGEPKLNVCRKVLADVMARENRTATAAEVIAGLEAHLNRVHVPDEALAKGVAPPPHLTLAKAREIAATGTWARPGSRTSTPIEDQILGPEKADEAKDEARPVAEQPKADAPKAEPPKAAGPAKK